MLAEQNKLAIVPRAPHAIAHHEAPDIFRVGEMLARSGYFTDAKEAAQAFVKVLAGRELGIGDVQAMTGIYIVKGKVSLSANLMAALVKRSGRYNYRVLRLDDAACEIEFFEGGASIGRSSFSKEDARKANLAGDNWQKFARNMLFARAMSNGVKFYCPDVAMSPLYTPDELGAEVDGETGEMVNVTPAEPHSAPANEPAKVAPHGDEKAQGTPATRTQPAAEDAAAPDRAQLEKRVMELCVALGYDAEKQAQAAAKLAKKTDDEIRKTVIPSLEKLLAPQEAERARLRKLIYETLQTPAYNYSDAEITEYFAKNYEGEMLETMSLEQLRKVADGMELK